MLVKLLDVQTSATLVHLHLSVHWALDLNRLRTVSLLSVELTTVHCVNLHHFSLVVLSAALASAVGSGDDGLTRRVIAEVRLVHQLLIERRVHVCVVVLDRLRVGLVDLGPVLEELVQD